MLARYGEYDGLPLAPLPGLSMVSRCVDGAADIELASIYQQPALW